MIFKMMNTALLIAVTLIITGCQSIILNFFRANPDSSPQQKLSESSLSQSENIAHWYFYLSKDGSYTALFPGKPEELDPLPGDNSTKRTDYQIGEMYYAIQTTKYAKKFSTNDVEKLLISRIHGAEYPDIPGRYTLSYNKQITFNGHNAREFVVIDNKYASALRSRIFFDVSKSILYEIWVSTGESRANGQQNSPETETFLNSLILKYSNPK
jgi:hypothetical protein